MATPIDKATASPRTLTVGGVEYRFTPLSAKAWGEYFAWCKGEFVDTVKRNVGDLEPKDRQVILTQMFERAATLNMESPEIQAISTSPAGVFRLVRMHLLPCHPAITEQEVAELLNSPEILRASMNAIEDTVDMESPHPKARKGKRRGKR